MLATAVCAKGGETRAEEHKRPVMCCPAFSDDARSFRLMDIVENILNVCFGDDSACYIFSFFDGSRQFEKEFKPEVLSILSAISLDRLQSISYMLSDKEVD